MESFSCWASCESKFSVFHFGKCWVRTNFVCIDTVLVCIDTAIKFCDAGVREVFSCFASPLHWLGRMLLGLWLEDLGMAACYWPWLSAHGSVSRRCPLSLESLMASDLGGGHLGTVGWWGKRRALYRIWGKFSLVDYPGKFCSVMDLYGCLLNIFFCTPVYLRCLYGLLTCFPSAQKFPFSTLNFSWKLMLLFSDWYCIGWFSNTLWMMLL